MLTPLLMTHILGLLPSSLLHALVSSSGSHGYFPLKEMLQNGVPGRTLLLESCDLRTIDSGSATPHCCYVYTFDQDGGNPNFDEVSEYIPKGVTHVNVLSNMRTIPRGLLANCTTLETIDLSQLSQAAEI